MRVPPPSSGEVSERFFSASDRFAQLPGSGSSGSGHASGGSGGDTSKGAGSGKGVGNGAGDAVGLYRPPPVYPVEARRRAIEGAVVVKFTVIEDGSCADVQIAETSGFTMLDEAATQAVQEWKYKPLAVSTSERIRFVFRLDR